MQLFLLDPIGPFFRDLPHQRFNWSKIDFHAFENSGGLSEERQRKVVADFETICQRAADMGFNAITLDDLPHLMNHAAYPPVLQAKLDRYRTLYRRIIRIAAQHGLAVYVTSDIMYYHPALERSIGRRVASVCRFLKEVLGALFQDYPEVAGIIFRFGESDGLDVRGDFCSRLVLRTPRQAHQFLQHMLPVFEDHDRKLVFRTWSVGAYPIGDLIWNRRTFDQVFGGITSDYLIISMKYGESDFFRYLPSNKLFFRSQHQKIVELQARREYEGFGEYPSFVGHDYHDVLGNFRSEHNVIGAQIWCQTGGWTIFRRLTMLEPEGIWNEINAFVTLRMCRFGDTPDEAIRIYWQDYLGVGDPDALIELLGLSDEVIKDLLYIEDFAKRKIFFRRLRVPPLLSVFWDHVLVNHSMRKVLRTFVTDGERAVQQGYRALDKIDRMRELADRAGLPRDDLDFMYDTYALLAQVREYYFLPFDESRMNQLRASKAIYKTAHRDRYAFHLDFQRSRLSSTWIRRLARLVLRHQRGYRAIDRILVVQGLSRLYPLVRWMLRPKLPSFARRQAMGIDVIFK